MFDGLLVLLFLVEVALVAMLPLVGLVASGVQRNRTREVRAALRKGMCPRV